ncbi:hypothetical protein IIA79_07075 [bacterium]|nr:hypothetical protein [bacterium]
MIANSPRQPRVRNLITVLAFITGLMLLGGWASGLSLQALEDGQQITVELPESFVPASYPFWVARISKYSAELKDKGGHSLIIDYAQDESGRYYLELGILGIDYSEANDWVRHVMKQVPELSGRPYAITQPLVPYWVSVREMVAFKLGDTEVIERNVVRAWMASRERPSSSGIIYIIARPSDSPPRRVSMVNH